VKHSDHKKSTDAKARSVAHFHKTQFLILGAAVYAASLADMHQTLQERKYSWWYQRDPLAKPLWKMGHSRKWHRLAAIPQILALAGNR
jgi:hypothetical protein